jgi:hypothetical protein
MRLGAGYEAKIDEIAAIRGGLKKVQVVRLAIEIAHKKICGGRRRADLVPPKVRPGRRRGPPG